MHCQLTVAALYGRLHPSSPGGCLGVLGPFWLILGANMVFEVFFFGFFLRRRSITNRAGTPGELQ